MMLIVSFASESGLPKISLKFAPMPGIEEKIKALEAVFEKAKGTIVRRANLDRALPDEDKTIVEGLMAMCTHFGIVRDVIFRRPVTPQDFNPFLEVRFDRPAS